MKIYELLEQKTTIPANNTKRLILLKGMINNGQSPEINVAKYTRDGFSFGDLEQLGYAEEICNRSRAGYVCQWMYTGPNSIIVGGSIMKSGDKTEPVEVDIS